MNAIAFGTVARNRLGIMSNDPMPDQPLDAAWIVLEAANDLGDDVTVEFAGASSMRTCAGRRHRHPTWTSFSIISAE